MVKVYNKLVRDKIPKIIADDGKKAIISKVKDKNHLRQLLLDKLFEEVKEYKENYSLEEIADILEIIYALIEVVEEQNFEIIDEIRRKKAKSRGGFKDGIILNRVVYS